MDSTISETSNENSQESRNKISRPGMASNPGSKSNLKSIATGILILFLVTMLGVVFFWLSTFDLDEKRSLTFRDPEGENCIFISIKQLTTSISSIKKHKVFAVFSRVPIRVDFRRSKIFLLKPQKEGEISIPNLEGAILLDKERRLKSLAFQFDSNFSRHLFNLAGQSSNSSELEFLPSPAPFEDIRRALESQNLELKSFWQD